MEKKFRKHDHAVNNIGKILQPRLHIRNTGLTLIMIRQPAIAEECDTRSRRHAPSSRKKRHKPGPIFIKVLAHLHLKPVYEFLRYA